MGPSHAQIFAHDNVHGDLEGGGRPGEGGMPPVSIPFQSQPSRGIHALLRDSTHTCKVSAPNLHTIACTNPTEDRRNPALVDIGAEEGGVWAADQINALRSNPSCYVEPAVGEITAHATGELCRQGKEGGGGSTASSKWLCQAPQDVTAHHFVVGRGATEPSS